VPEPSCATRKLATLTFVLRGHLPNITLCTTRNSYSCYTVKVPRRRPDPLRLFSHLSRNSAPGVCGKPQLKRRRTAMPIRNGRVSAPPLAGAREEANDQAGRRSPRQGRADGGYFVTTRRDAPPACATRIPDLLPVHRAARIESGNWLQTGFRMPSTASSGFRAEPLAAAGTDRIRASRSKWNGGRPSR